MSPRLPLRAASSSRPTGSGRLIRRRLVRGRRRSPEAGAALGALVVFGRTPTLCDASFPEEAEESTRIALLPARAAFLGDLMRCFFLRLAVPDQCASVLTGRLDDHVVTPVEQLVASLVQWGDHLRRPSAASNFRRLDDRFDRLPRLVRRVRVPARADHPRTPTMARCSSRAGDPSPAYTRRRESAAPCRRPPPDRQYPRPLRSALGAG